MRRSPWLSLALVSSLAALVGCGPDARPAASPQQGQGAGDPAGAAIAGPRSAVAATLAACPDTPAPAGDPRASGIEALLGGEPGAAERIFAEVARTRPGDAAAEAFLAASKASLAAAGARAAAKAEAVPVVHLGRLPLTPVAGSGSVKGAKVRLTKASEQRNSITDEEAWLSGQGLTMRTNRDTARAHAHVGRTLRGERAFVVFEGPDHDVTLYGRPPNLLVVTAPGKAPRVFDASAATTSLGSQWFDIDFAQLVGRVLVVQLAYNGYSSNSNGKNGYVAAFDAESGKLLWSSAPLTGNLGNFHIAGGSVIAGYGFTDEPDFLYVLDLATGAVDQKIPLKSGPRAILAKGDRIHVRTYDTDYVFRPEGALPPSPAAELTAAVETRPGAPVGPEARCWARAAVAALDRRDGRALAEAVQGLAQQGVEQATVASLDQARAGLDARQGGRGSIDLGTAAPIVLAAPPWGYAAPAPSALPPGKPPKLVKLGAAQADPVRSTGGAGDPARRDWFLASVDRGNLPSGAPTDVPSTYGEESLHALIHSGDRRLLVYGGRYLAITRGSRAERVFDFEAYRHAPETNPEMAEFSVEDVTYAQLEGGTLYVCNGGGTYAREVKGKKGFVSALDASTGRLLWRSEPLVCNATFVMAGDYLVTGYGFTAEPDHVFLLRRADGKVMQKVAIESGPSLICWENGRILVEAYSNRYLFDLKP
ncbi:outer membrane protein assembly factor BamB family protein [Chondromyces apiculatus]|uniref:Pyrrolo-quinoline quinone repeat domain-containing protein n=1 Tax=Chondromyces apiculatus DSM 436 TaxID=1192034 RepID=A0A017TGJ0_9BACT|nr:PQQ-binding-like beta-propeller repeat protein [Chondromyces apiculatus]EYF07711.1 Hypothetical protein CAP_8212 [Chondromyces apiculatus DSM 436]